MFRWVLFVRFLLAVSYERRQTEAERDDETPIYTHYCATFNSSAVAGRHSRWNVPRLRAAFHDVLTAICSVV